MNGEESNGASPSTLNDSGVFGPIDMTKIVEIETHDSEKIGEIIFAFLIILIGRVHATSYGQFELTENETLSRVESQMILKLDSGLPKGFSQSNSHYLDS